MPTPLLLVAAVLLQVGACFSLWTWRLAGSTIWLIAGAVALALFGGLVFAMDLTNNAWPAFFGLYICSGVVWSWCAQGLGRADRAMTETIVFAAGAAMILVSLV